MKITLTSDASILKEIGQEETGKITWSVEGTVSEYHVYKNNKEIPGVLEVDATSYDYKVNNSIEATTIYKIEAIDSNGESSSITVTIDVSYVIFASVGDSFPTLKTTTIWDGSTAIESGELFEVKATNNEINFKFNVDEGDYFFIAIPAIWNSKLISYPGTYVADDTKVTTYNDLPYIIYKSNQTATGSTTITVVISK